MHILLHFVNDDKLETAEDIDGLISADFPDPVVDPEVHEIIKTYMIHGPCGILNPNSPCMKDGKCTKKFPNTFSPPLLQFSMPFHATGVSITEE